MIRFWWPFTTSKQVADASKSQPPKELSSVDPLDMISRGQRREAWPVPPERPEDKFLKVEDFPYYDPVTEKVMVRVKDATEDADKTVSVFDAAGDGSGGQSLKGAGSGGGRMSDYAVPPAIEGWYSSQGFIGYQACAIIAQHWLVDKACTMSGEDAIRNGWELKTDGEELTDAQLSEITELDKRFHLKENLSELNRFKNIFGIRVLIFEVESPDEDYYEKPFNIDGVTKGSYKGISQVDPYWMTPVMTAASTSNPAGIHFYDPEYWVISGRKYHRSHLIIARGPQPADILKPTYVFGGVPLTQRIYERVYAAERTANEAPLLALNKRTTTIHVDTDKALLNEKSFLEKILLWVKYRDNHAIKVLGKEETMEQFDTSLTDFDSVIMNQYQIVAAIAKTPATKLLGTSPKGFNSTGEFESISYHEELESIQEHTMDPTVERHYAIAMRSLGYNNIKLKVVWNPVDSISTTARAELNAKKAATDEINVNIGAVSPDEIRQRLRDDGHSGYNRLTDDVANEKPGMSPENLAEFEKAGAEKRKAVMRPLPSPGSDPAATGEDPEKNFEGDAPKPGMAEEIAPAKPDPNAAILSALEALSSRLDQLADRFVPEYKDIEHDASPGVGKLEPSVIGSVSPGTSGLGALVPEYHSSKLPVIRLKGITAAIENPRGSIRQGRDGAWRQKMPHHYGFIKGTKGADGHEVDCFIGPNLRSNKAYVVNQLGKDGKFDEHKVMFGFETDAEAKAGYMGSYHNKWTGFGDMVSMDLNAFRKWLATADLNLPAELKGLI